MSAPFALLAATTLVMICSGCIGALGSGEVPERSELNNTPGANNPPVVPQNNKPGQPREPSTFACDPSERLADLPLRRLSRVQYINSLRDTLAASLPQSDVQAVLAQVQLDLMPDDTPGRAQDDTHGGYKQLDQALRQGHVDGSFEIAKSIGRQVADSPDLRQKMMGVCATDNDPANDAQCVDDWIASFGGRALRAPLSASDAAFYRSVYDASGIEPDAIADVMTVVLSAPQFLYHVEHGQVSTAQDDGSAYELSAMELANRLSYSFWQTMPDEELWTTAQDGSLLQEDVYNAQLDRLVSDARSGQSVREFFKAWLWLDEVEDTGGLVGTPRYDAFAGDNLPSMSLRQQMIDEILDMAVYYTLTTNGSFGDFLNSQGVFARQQELADVYGVDPWNGQSTPAAFPEGERVGLVSRAGLLFNDTISTSPIHRGFFVRRALLCVQPPPPPDNAAGVKIELSETATTREVVEAITEQEGTSCAGCHQTFLNPLGFALEGYDALGRVRTTQRLFDENGAVVLTRPVDTTSNPQVVLGDQTPSTGAQDMGRQLDQSKEVHKCFAQNYARWTLGRVEDMKADGCFMEALREQVVADLPIRDVLKSIALRPEFKRRQTADGASQ